MENNLVGISKYLSFLLRHRPEAIKLELDTKGWAPIDEIIDKTTKFRLTRDLIEIVVETNDKKRFSISKDGRKIRANQGHTIEINLDLKPVQPPDTLLHGTAQRFIKSIEAQGLCKMKRHHVHLTESKAVALSVGQRYGKPVILEIPASQMSKDGHLFFKTSNNVWLVEHVPVKYLKNLTRL